MEFENDYVWIAPDTTTMDEIDTGTMGGQNG